MGTSNGGFFTRLFARKKPESAEPEVFVDDASRPTTSETLPHTLISFTPEQSAKHSEEFKEALQKQLLKLPPLRIGEINFVPFETGMLNGGYFVKVFIRNGKDIEEDLVLEEIPLYLVDATGEKVAGAVFKPQHFGVLKFGETRYWVFAWRPDQIYKQDADLSSFTVAFE